MRLAIVLSDFYLHPDEQGRSVDWVQALADSLRFATRRNLTTGWRDWLVQQSLSPEGSGKPVALPTPPTSLARRSWELLTGGQTPAPTACWFATPVHCRAGLNHVLLDARGCLRLSADEMAALLAEYARDFAGSAWQLIDAGDGRLLLGAQESIATVTTQPPEPWLGSNIAAALPVGPGAARLRAVAGEIELWLFGASLNRQRAQRGIPTVTQLWFWDRPCHALWATPVAQAAPPWPQLYGQDAAVAALFAAHGQALRVPPQSPDDLLAAGSSQDAALIFPTQESSGPNLQEFLERWWLPAQAGLRAGRLRALQLVANERLFELRAQDRWRLWRRPRPWYQVLAS
jgi:hypothetical protein